MKNNININRQPLTQSDIEKGKNFDALLKKHNAVTKPFYKTKLFLSSVVVTSVIVVFTTIYLLNHKPSTLDNKQIVKDATLSKTDSNNAKKAILANVNDTTINRIKTSNHAIAQINKGTTKSNFVLATSSTTSDTTTLSDIYRHFDKAPQTFIISSNKDTSITSAEGTIIKVKAHSFLDKKSGSELKGNILIRVKEYYKLSDILLAKLSTMSDSNILETGGMINITAYYNNKVCVLKKSKPIEISFPTRQKKNDMQLFSGTWTNDYLINWSLDTGSQTSNTNYNTSDSGYRMSVVLNSYSVGQTGVNTDSYSNCTMPLFDKNDPALKYGFHRLISYPKYYEKNIQPVYVSFIVYKDGHVGDARIVRSSYHTLDSAALDCVRHLPKCEVPGKKDGLSVDVQMMTNVQFISKHGNTAAKGDYNVLINPGVARFRYYTTDSTTLLKQGAAELNYYMFNTTTLGWINCDRFENNSIARVDYTINCDKNEDNNVSMVFHRYKAILNGYKRGGQFTFWVPDNEDVTIVAVKYENGKPYLAVKEAKTSATPENDLVYQPATISSLQTEMEKLDQ